MNNEKDKLTTQQILRHYQIEHGPVNLLQKETLESSIEKALTTARRETRTAVFREAIEIIGGVEETDPERNTWTTDCIRALEAATTKQPTEVKEGDDGTAAN